MLRLGLSRTPVREALARLQEDGLVETEPKRYTRVAPLDRREARDAFPVVAALHALAAELGVRHLTAADMRTMRAQNERFAQAIARRDVDAAMASDDAFHGVFVDASANPAIAATPGPADAAPPPAGAAAVRIPAGAAVGQPARGDHRRSRRATPRTPPMPSARTGSPWEP